MTPRSPQPRQFGPTITSEAYGVAPDGPVERYTLTNGSIQVTILTYGGALQSIRVPDRDGRIADVSLGLPEVAGYVERRPYLGAITGRYANRIAGGRFDLDGASYRLPRNEEPNCLHGGVTGFDCRVWAATPLPGDTEVGLRLEFTSPAGDQGFPGELRTSVTYTVTASHGIRMEYEATTDVATVVNLTNHALFNLAGEGSGSVEGHLLYLNADRYLPVDDELIPTGEVSPVAGTPMDFTRPTAIGERIRDRFRQLTIGRGYDHTYVINQPDGRDTEACHQTGVAGGNLLLAARVYEPGSGRTLTVLTTEPGVQFYAGNSLDGSLIGTGGAAYRQTDGFALETQHFPDAPNRPEFPSTVLRPGQTYRTTTVYQFGVADGPTHR